MAPSNLVYPQSSINAVVGLAIQAETPTVSGTVTGYAANPQLPAGLTLNQSTGTISGTPTAASSSASYTVTASNSSGSTSATIQIAVAPAAPSNLVYPQTTISAIVGVTVPTDTPTVTGTVSGYSVSPSLPAGLTMNQTTGAISGTPTTVSASASYTITASNPTGSTTATIQISVGPAPPSNLVYPQTTITGTVGTAIPADTPTVTGTVAKYSVSPALPAGITIDTTSGTIAGTPATASAQATYTITATNATGSTAAQITITVTQTSKVLLELGHGTSVIALRTAGARVLSEDLSGHWNLWDYTTAKIITSGDGGFVTTTQGGQSSGQIDLAGQVAVVGTTSSIQILSATDGSALGSVPSATWLKLATDGSYLCTGSTAGLTVWSTSGQQEFTRTGDYSKAVVFAAPNQVQVATGPAGTSVIETIAVPSGTSTGSPAFQGTFYQWFPDGSRFLSTLSNTVWTYSNAGVQQAIVSLPSVKNLTAYGNWIVTTTTGGSSPNYNDVVNVYAIGATSPAYTFNTTLGSQYSASGPLIAAFSYSTSIIDLSGATPTMTNYVGLQYPPTFAAVTASQWLVGNGNGRGSILDGATLATTPRFFGYGEVGSIAATSSLIALSTSRGILLLDPSGNPIGTPIPLEAPEVQLSANGSILGATGAWLQTPQSGSVSFYSLPSQNLVSTYPEAYVNSANFELAASGTTIGIVETMSVGTPTRTVEAISGTPVIWSDSGINAAIALSPDGTLFAAASENLSSPTPSSQTPTTSIYKNGTLSTTIPAYPEGWIDNSHLLAANWTYSVSYLAWILQGTTIYGPDGTQIATIPATTMPGIADPVFPTTSSVYDPVSDAIYSLPSGALIWKAPPAPTTQYVHSGGVSGSYVVSQFGHQVVLYAY